NLILSDDQPLRIPPLGAHQLRVLAPSLLELTYVVPKKQDAAHLPAWDFIDSQGDCKLPKVQQLLVTAGARTVSFKAVGFKREVVYAPLKKWDLRVGSWLYLELGGALESDQTVEVKNPDKSFWPESVRFVARNDPFRWSPILHVNQTGYAPGFPKQAMVGYY